jgi:predicted MPP superfamily phosphohydrolase
MRDIDEAHTFIEAARVKREAWTSARRRIEHGRFWVGPDGRRRRWRSKVLHAALGIFALGLKVTGHYTRWRQNALDPELAEFELRFVDLPPEFDGYRILLVSDPHLDILPELATIARDMLTDLPVDLLAMTGDVLGRRHAPIVTATGPLAAALQGVDAHDGRLAVLGNHDPCEMVEGLERIGFRVLINETIMLKRAGAQIAITGLDDVHAFYTEAAHAALMEEPGGFRVALIHSPEMADHAARANVALYLCGHTHGGQICLPNGRPLFTALTRCRQAASGCWRQGRTQGYTSRGLGSSWPPLRLNCPGEITIVTLRRAENTQADRC